MKLLITLCLLSAFTIGCQKQDGPPSLHDGGMSGGGGGTLPANPIGVYRAKEMIADAKKQLRLYFRFERQYNFVSQIPDSQFSLESEGLQNQLEKTDIEILEDKPCKDLSGTDVDASVVASRPNTICISAFRIAPKLIEENANKEILALLVHELSHFLGANEKEALDLQKYVAIRLEDIPKDFSADLWNKMWDATIRIEGLVSKARSILEALRQGDLKQVRAELTFVQNVLRAYDEHFESLPFAYTDYTIGDYQYLLMIKLRIVDYYISSIDESNPLRDESKQLLDECFAGNTTLTFGEISKNCHLGDKDNIYVDETIQRPARTEDLEDVTNELIYFLHDLSGHVRALTFDQPLPFFHLPSNKNSTNPWGHFVGTYSAELTKCSSTLPDDRNYFSEFRTIEIYNEKIHYPVTEDVIYLKLASQNMTSSDPVYNGSSNNGTGKVFGDHASAVFEVENGNRWYDRQAHGWSKTTTHIYKNSTGELFFEMSREFFSYNFNGLNQGAYSCQYKLKY